MRFQSDSTISREADGPKKGPTSSPPSNRDRVLEAACELFAEAGFHGTHLREICKRAGTNVAGICYHFQGKEGLYQAVMMEAGRQLSDVDGNFAASTQLPPEQRLLALTGSLLQRLGAKRAWIAKLLTRELVDHADTAHSHAASRLERDFVLFQAVMSELLGPDTPSDAVRLHALTLIGECIFYSLTGENPRHPLSQITVTPSTRTLARFLTQRSLRALQHESAQPEVSRS
jgi:AcrR family transcriptional regulator